VWSRATPVFDDENLVSCAGLVPVMALAERAGLSELIGERVSIDSLESTRVASAAVSPAGKLTSIIAGMAAGADSIDDLDLIRSGRQGWRSAEPYAAVPCGGQAFPGAIEDQLADELGERGEDVEHQPAAGCRGVQRLVHRSPSSTRPCPASRSANLITASVSPKSARGRSNAIASSTRPCMASSTAPT
jgi:hypothetical protein